MKNLLGICIPTYNRAEYLQQNLELIIEQVNGYDFPIYISDNSDNSDSEILVNELKNKYENIHYKRNESNLGFDRNLLQVVGMSETEYVWLFGDDDLIEAGYIDRIVSEIRNETYDLIVVNSSTHSMDMNIEIEERHLPIDEDIVFKQDEYNSVLSSLGSYTTYLGCIVLKKKLWDSIKIDDLSLVEDFVHIKKVYEMLLHTTKKTLFISYPYLKLRLANATWSHRKIKVWFINWPNTICSLKEYKSEICNKLITPISIKGMLYERAKGALGFRSWKDYIFTKNDITFLKKIAILLLSIAPRFILKRWFLEKLKKSGNKYLFYELTGKLIDG